MSQFELDTECVRTLALLLKETGLSEIEYVEGDKKIRCVGPQAPVVNMAPAPYYAAAPQAPMAPAPAAPAAEAAPAKKAATDAITSPMVGTVYLAPEPGAPTFVKIGDKVKAGDTLVIIEAMKVMNPIKATKAGTVSEVLVSDAQPVEFGEPLIVIA